LQEFENKIKEIVGSLGYFFIGVNWKGNKNNPLIEVLIDTENGIIVSECSKVSKEISKYLDSASNLERYRLDVSSPGIDIPLKEDWQFRKNVGRKIDIQFKEGDSNIHKKGILSGILEGTITISLEDETKIEINKERIILAKVII
jgi:ribosome maturation factor RimP